jgi:hypothetical protein
LPPLRSTKNHRDEIANAVLSFVQTRRLFLQAGNTFRILTLVVISLLIAAGSSCDGDRGAASPVTFALRGSSCAATCSRDTKFRIASTSIVLAAAGASVITE